MARSIRIGVAAATMLVAASSAAFAFGVFPGSWKFSDSGKAVRKPSGTLRVALVQNNGPDVVIVSSKGANETISGPVQPGTRGWLAIPTGGKNIKILDANFGNSKGARGTVIWMKKLPKTGPIIGGGGGQQ